MSRQARQSKRLGGIRMARRPVAYPTAHELRLAQHRAGQSGFALKSAWAVRKDVESYARTRGATPSAVS